MITFEEYIKDVKSQLVCNATKEYKSEHITYMFSNQEVDNNLDYFLKSMNDGLSPYKALLYFDLYLEENYLK